LNSQLLERSAFAIWNIHLASRRRLIAWCGAGLVNARFWPVADIAPGRSGRGSDNVCLRSFGDVPDVEALALHSAQRRLLLAVLIIDLAMFFIESGAGIVARSSALQANAVDMLGDAILHGLSLWAVNRGPRWEAGAALAKGLLILLFFVFIVVEVVIKLVHGVPPSSGLMLGFGAIALVAISAWHCCGGSANSTST